ncbi:MAG: hypothetical protein HOJ54_04370 [Phycisphaerae bacterium]|nr:hypothetical protein [Phycisphaerae bacterium]
MALSIAVTTGLAAGGAAASAYDCVVQQIMLPACVARRGRAGSCVVGDVPHEFRIGKIRSE